MKGVLILENGQKFYGNMLMDEPAVGEVVFNTGMQAIRKRSPIRPMPVRSLP